MTCFLLQFLDTGNDMHWRQSPAGLAASVPYRISRKREAAALRAALRLGSSVPYFPRFLRPRPTLSIDDFDVRS
jgi:hypothetical protein